MQYVRATAQRVSALRASAIPGWRIPPPRKIYFFLPATAFAATASFFFLAFELLDACFCEAFLLVAFGDLSPISGAAWQAAPRVASGKRRLFCLAIAPPNRLDERVPERPETGSLRVLIFVDESNVVSSVRALGRKLDWLQLRDHLTRPKAGRRLIEMVIYAGLPPPMPEWQAERDKKNKFLHWLRSNGFLVVTKDGSPGDGRHYKANVDVLLAIDAVELSVEMRPDVVVLVTGDADFVHLALQLRRRGIRVEVASTATTMGGGLKGAANEVIDLVPLFETFERMEE